MRKFLKKETTILGFLPEDSAVQKAVLAQKPYYLLYPNASISKRMLAIAATFVKYRWRRERAERNRIPWEIEKYVSERACLI